MDHSPGRTISTGGSTRSSHACRCSVPLTMIPGGTALTRLLMQGVPQGFPYPGMPAGEGRANRALPGSMYNIMYTPLAASRHERPPYQREDAAAGVAAIAR